MSPIAQASNHRRDGGTMDISRREQKHCGIPISWAPIRMARSLGGSGDDLARSGQRSDWTV